MLTISSLGLQ